MILLSFIIGIVVGLALALSFISIAFIRTADRQPKILINHLKDLTASIERLEKAKRGEYEHD